MVVVVITVTIVPSCIPCVPRLPLTLDTTGAKEDLSSLSILKYT